MRNFIAMLIQGIIKENNTDVLFYQLEALKYLASQTSLLYKHEIKKSIIDSGFLAKLMALLKCTQLFFILSNIFYNY